MHIASAVHVPNAREQGRCHVRNEAVREMGAAGALLLNHLVKVARKELEDEVQQFLFEHELLQGDQVRMASEGF